MGGCLKDLNTLIFRGIFAVKCNQIVAFVGKDFHLISHLPILFGIYY